MAGEMATIAIGADREFLRLDGGLGQMQLSQNARRGSAHKALERDSRRAEIAESQTISPVFVDPLFSRFPVADDRRPESRLSRRHIVQQPLDSCASQDVAEQQMRDPGAGLHYAR